MVGNLVVDSLSILVLAGEHAVDGIQNKAGCSNAEENLLDLLRTGGRIQQSEGALNGCVVEEVERAHELAVITALREVHGDVPCRLSCPVLRDPTVNEGLVGRDPDAVFNDGVVVLEEVQDGANALAHEAVLDGRPFATDARLRDVAEHGGDVVSVVRNGVHLVGGVLATSLNKLTVHLGPLGAVVVVPDRAGDTLQSGRHTTQGIRGQALHLELVDLDTRSREVSDHVRDDELRVIGGVDGGKVAIDLCHRTDEAAPSLDGQAVLAVHRASHGRIGELDKGLLAVLLHDEDVGLVVCLLIGHLHHLSAA